MADATPKIAEIPALGIPYSEIPYSEIRCERDGPVITVTINRPEVHNCISPTTAAELVSAFDRFRDDDSALVLVLTGAGDKAFCAGADLRRAAELVPTDPAELAAHAAGLRPGLIGPTRWTDLYKPVIAAINGLAYAGGLEWACFADMRIAEAHATFGVTCRRWNVGLGDGGTQRLPRIVGHGRAMDLILTGRVIDAVEAHQMGLVNEIVPTGQSMARALVIAHQLAALPQQAMRTDKEAVLRGSGLPLRQGLAIEAECFNRLIEEPEEMLKGVRRFLERDHPDRQKGGIPGR